MFTEKLKEVYRRQVALMGAHYQRALDAKAEGRPVVYVTAMFPVEIVKAFEPYAAVVYPENHAALLISKDQDQLLSAAEAKGVDRMGCAYELFNTGYLLEGYGGADGPDLKDERGRSITRLAEPDILLSCDNQCRVVCEWFKHLSEIYGDRPYKMINVGDRYDGSLDDQRTAYMRKQLEDLIAWLEKAVGRRFDRDRFLETARLSSRAIELWQRYLDMGTLKPSPMTAFDGFSHMAVIVSERGSPQAVEYYQKLIEATEELANKRISAVGTERRRLLWDNLATWYNFRQLQQSLAAQGIAVVGSTYLDAWRKRLDVSSYDTLMDSMARTYAAMYTNMTMEERFRLWVENVEKYNADGVLFHKNLSCHTFSLRVAEIADRLEKHFAPDFRTVVFEGCQGIKGRFQKHAFETGVQVHFVEQ